MISLKHRKNWIYIHKLDKFDFKTYLVEKLQEASARGYDSVSVTDWKMDVENSYFGIVEPYVKKVMDSIAIDLYQENAKHAEKIVQECWFQSYFKNSDHFWHTHGYAHFANVFFIDLPEPLLKTDIFNIEYPDAQEGDILSFPAFLLHMSPMNFLDHKKTIISWNHVYIFPYRWDQ